MSTLRKACAAPVPCSRFARTRWLSLLISVACSGAFAQSSEWNCGNLYVNNFGPFDYRTEQGSNKRVVENHHFTPKVERLQAGESATLGADIDYTLRAFPNHHRALLAMMSLAKRSKTDQPKGAQFSVECYFRRAVTFRPDDQVARMLYAKFLATTARTADALRQLEQASEMGLDSPLTQYNIGLLFFEMGEFDKAVTQLQLIERMGFDGKPLRDNLEAKGKWPPSVLPRPVSAPSGASSGAR